MSRRVIKQDAPRQWRSETLPQLQPAELERLVEFLARTEAIFSPEPTVQRREGFNRKQKLSFLMATDPHCN